MINSSAFLGSFRDPSGFVFYKNGILFRQVNDSSKEDFDLLINSGLYQKLVGSGLLISHEEISDKDCNQGGVYKIIRPLPVPFISYPYEWCFSQFKAAALATLATQKAAMESGMSLKDCSAYNIQFIRNKPVFIDTLSFSTYKEGEPWVAYGQFCRHFLAPLALMSFSDIRLGQLLKAYIDGIPLDLVSNLLPLRTRFMFSLASHLHFHAQMHNRVHKGAGSCRISRFSLLALIDNLESAINKLCLRTNRNKSMVPYPETGCPDNAIEHRKQLVAGFLKQADPKAAWDFSGLGGAFGRLAAEGGVFTCCFHADPAEAEKNFLVSLSEQQDNIFPLVMDITNPSPGIGWANRERGSLFDRAPADAVLALDLMHRLVIFHNLPTHEITSFFAKICRWLIIEFASTQDPQVKKLLEDKGCKSHEYSQQAFLDAFGKNFSIVDHKEVIDSHRTVYLLRNANP